MRAQEKVRLQLLGLGSFHEAKRSSRQGTRLPLSPRTDPRMCATHGAPVSGEDDRLLVRTRVFKPVAEPENLRFEIGTGSVPFTAFNLALPSGCFPPCGLGISTCRAGGTRYVRHTSGFLFAAFRFWSAACDKLSGR